MPMIGWLLNTEETVYHPINDLGTLYPGAYVTEKPTEPVIGTLTPVRRDGKYEIVAFQVHLYDQPKQGK